MHLNTYCAQRKHWPNFDKGGMNGENNGLTCQGGFIVVEHRVQEIGLVCPLSLSSGSVLPEDIFAWPWVTCTVLQKHHKMMANRMPGMVAEFWQKADGKLFQILKMLAIIAEMKKEQNLWYLALYRIDVRANISPDGYDISQNSKHLIYSRSFIQALDDMSQQLRKRKWLTWPRFTMIAPF